MTINLISTNLNAHHTQIEWDVLSNIISQFAYFEANKRKLISTHYLDRLDDLLNQFSQTALYLNTINDDLRDALRQILSRVTPELKFNKYLLHLAKEGILNFSELNHVAKLLESAIFIKQSFQELKIPETNRILNTDFRTLEKNFLKDFRYLVDDSGEIHFDRNLELAELKQRLRDLEERIRRSLQEWINEPSHGKLLQYSNYDVIYDRYVVPVRSDSYRAELGFIVSRSESGQSLFVEPTIVREVCNKRLEIIAKIDEFINQLMIKFSKSLFNFSDLANSIYSDFQELDFYLSKSEFASRHKLEMPHIRSTPGFKFTGLFHPLLQNPIKNSVICTSKDKGIVISGPNTGGKTVFLKSISLSYLLFYHGFYVPAAEAEMYPYSGLFYFGNDLQNLEYGLSSFSGEVQNYIELLENLLPSNLILIDEIFNSTSSDEASALSLAYFDELHKMGICHLVVSTHHQMFKTLVHQNHDYLSCHVGFDTSKMKPTYKIQWGTPGSSMAIDIFRILTRNHKLLEGVPDRALKALNSKNISYETLLQKVSQKQIELDQLLGINRQHEIELKNQKGSLQGILKLKLNEELIKAQKEIERVLGEARNLLFEIKNNELIKPKKIDDLELKLKAEIIKLRGDAPEPVELERHQYLEIDQIKPGDMVYSFILKKDFLVQSIDLKKKEVVIGKGPIKMSVPHHSLGTTSRKFKGSSVSVTYTKNSISKFEYDARGMRLSDFQNQIDSAIGDLLSGDVPFLNIIHGHGDGVLKNWLRDYIKRSKEFKWEIPENGNDGETKITLK